MGESKKAPLRVEFDRQIKLASHGATVTSDAGLLADRELDGKLQLTSSAPKHLHETRTGQNTQLSIQALLRQSIYSRLAGYAVVNDAERLCLDPTIPTWIARSAKPMGTNRAVPSTGILVALVTIHCLFSISLGIWSEP